MLFTVFAAENSSLTTNFLQRPLRNLVKFKLNIWMQSVEKTILYPMAMSTTFLCFLPSCGQKHEKLLTDQVHFFSSLWGDVTLWSYLFFYIPLEVNHQSHSCSGGHKPCKDKKNISNETLSVYYIYIYPCSYGLTFFSIYIT